MVNFEESIRLYKGLKDNLCTFMGGTVFEIGDVKIFVSGKDGLGGLIEEWLGVWARKNKYNIESANTSGRSQEFLFLRLEMLKYLSGKDGQEKMGTRSPTSTLVQNKIC